MTSLIPVRDAATIIVVRRDGDRRSVLMGQRGKDATFMPGKFVFPGGAVDEDDSHVPVLRALSQVCHSRLQDGITPGLGAALIAAGIRELWEETGQILGQDARWDFVPPKSWDSFARTGHRPDAGAMRFVFRAITPPGRPRRFDARFFAVDAAAFASDPDDFSRAQDELSHLQWVPLESTRDFDLPFITQIALAEVAALTRSVGPGIPIPASVPFFKNDDEENYVLRLGDKPATAEERS
ncbi:MAG: NUDIX hydrolase [Pseudomonadota bacterium]